MNFIKTGILFLIAAGIGLAIYDDSSHSKPQSTNNEGGRID